MRDRCATDPAFAQQVLGSFPTTRQGWCRVVSNLSTKTLGYPQMSVGAANHFALLQTIMWWVKGEETAIGEDASHLCHNPRDETGFAMSLIATAKIITRAAVKDRCYSRGIVDR